MEGKQFVLPSEFEAMLSDVVKARISYRESIKLLSFLPKSEFDFAREKLKRSNQNLMTAIKLLCEAMGIDDRVAMARIQVLENDTNVEAHLNSLSL